MLHSGPTVDGHENLRGGVITVDDLLISATGDDFVLGDVNSISGFASNGALDIGSQTMTLVNTNDALFDSLSLVTMGRDGKPRELTTTNGLSLDFGGNIIGFGTLDTLNDRESPLIDYGYIGGSSAAEPMRLLGFIQGVGTLADVVIEGILSPGFSCIPNPR